MTKSFKCDEKTQHYINYIKVQNPNLKTESEIIRLALEFFVECIDVKKIIDRIK